MPLTIPFTPAAAGVQTQRTSIKSWVFRALRHRRRSKRLITRSRTRTLSAQARGGNECMQDSYLTMFIVRNICCDGMHLPSSEVSFGGSVTCVSAGGRPTSVTIGWCTVIWFCQICFILLSNDSIIDDNRRWVKRHLLHVCFVAGKEASPRH